MRASISDFYNYRFDKIPYKVFEKMKYVFDRESPSIRVYGSNIKSFACKVGYPVAHEDFQRNTAGLRKFHATQMPFFHKLQDDLQAKIKENNEIITALEFRHLIEHLPSNPYKEKTSASDRWLAFWEDVVRNEHDHPTDHTLKGLVNEKVFPHSSGQHNTKGSNEQPITRDFKGTIDEKAEKALMYRLGNELFGILNKNVHAFEGKGKDEYKVGSDHWGKGGETYPSA